MGARPRTVNSRPDTTRCKCRCCSGWRTLRMASGTEFRKDPFASNDECSGSRFADLYLRGNLSTSFKRRPDHQDLCIAFWLLDLDRIMESIDFCWIVLAVQRYSEVFEAPANDLLDRAVVSRYHESCIALRTAIRLASLHVLDADLGTLSMQALLKKTILFTR